MIPLMIPSSISEQSRCTKADPSGSSYTKLANSSMVAQRITNLSSVDTDDADDAVDADDAARPPAVCWSIFKYKEKIFKVFKLKF